ncbi:hypothetical protein NXS19_009951 [Fusarium pseudograminearum]|nr:hypothetical protein NXS19_009951 [Fusarium pseudograminearum]
MSSNNSSAPPGPINEVNLAEAHEGVPQDPNHCHRTTPRQPPFPYFAQFPYPYTYGPELPYSPQYNPYHHPLGYHHLRQAGYVCPFQQADFQSSQSSVPINPQTKHHDHHVTLPNQQQARQKNVTINDGMAAQDSPKSQLHLEDSKPIHLQPGPYIRESNGDSSRRSDTGVSFENVYEDEDVTEDRPPKKTIPKECLTRGEKMRLLDLLKQYEDVQRTKGALCSAIAKRMPHPAGRMMGPEGPKLSSKTIPIFLTLDLRAGEIEWRYHDKDGNRFKARDVRLHHGLGIEQAKKNVLDHQDQKEMKRICEHNIDQIVHAARRRIVKWAAAGSAAELGVDDEDRAALEILELPSERFLERFQEVRVLRDYIVRRPMPSYEG